MYRSALLLPAGTTVPKGSLLYIAWGAGIRWRRGNQISCPPKVPKDVREICTLEKDGGAKRAPEGLFG